MTRLLLLSVIAAFSAYRLFRLRKDGIPLPGYIHALAVIFFVIGSSLAFADQGVGAFTGWERLLMPALFPAAVYLIFGYSLALSEWRKRSRRHEPRKQT